MAKCWKISSHPVTLITEHNSKHKVAGLYLNCIKSVVVIIHLRRFWFLFAREYVWIKFRKSQFREKFCAIQSWTLMHTYGASNYFPHNRSWHKKQWWYRGDNGAAIFVILTRVFTLKAPGMALIRPRSGKVVYQSGIR